jgi:hypothetical protein
MLNRREQRKQRRLGRNIPMLWAMRLVTSRAPIKIIDFECAARNGQALITIANSMSAAPLGAISVFPNDLAGCAGSVSLPELSDRKRVVAFRRIASILGCFWGGRGLTSVLAKRYASCRVRIASAASRCQN